MNNSSGSGFQSVAIWMVKFIPFFGIAVVWYGVLSAGEFMDGMEGKGCNQPIDFVVSPQSPWNKAGCVVNGIRQVIPSRGSSNTNNTAP